MQKLNEEKLTHKELQRHLDYNHLTGIFTRKVRSSKSVHIGDIAGYKKKNGYISIAINRKQYFAHRLAWFYYYGYMPENQIDHIDSNPLHRHHNWISNLREAAQQCQERNKGNFKNNSSGVKGIHWDNKNNKWIARIMINYKNKWLGRFKDFDEAICHRLAAEQCLNWSDCNNQSSAYLYVKENIQ